MNIRASVAIAAAVPLLLFASTASALTMNQFSAICGTWKGDCSEHPTLHAYVGGALDLIAVLDEETDYLAEIYCRKSAELFHVPGIIQFMIEHQQEYATHNAMLVVVRYLEEKGKCQSEIRNEDFQNE